MMYTKHFLLSFAAIYLGACEPSGKVDQTQTESADTDRLQNAARALPILTGRLHQNVKLEGDIIVVTGSRANGFFAMSKNTPWTVTCGSGVSVSFDKAQVDLVSTRISVDDRQCATLTVQTASAVRAVIGEPEKAKSPALSHRLAGKSKWSRS